MNAFLLSSAVSHSVATHCPSCSGDMEPSWQLYISHCYPPGGKETKLHQLWSTTCHVDRKASVGRSWKILLHSGSEASKIHWPQPQISDERKAAPCGYKRSSGNIRKVCRVRVLARKYNSWWLKEWGDGAWSHNFMGLKSTNLALEKKQRWTASSLSPAHSQLWWEGHLTYIHHLTEDLLPFEEDFVI